MFIVFPRMRLRLSVLALPSFLLMLWLEGLMPFCLMLFSAAFHELGHLAALRQCGRRARRIDILPMGALIVCPEGISDRDEALIALAGPLFSLFLFALSAIGYLIFGTVFFLFAAVINLVLAVFNLLPERKLDGGKALYCFLLSITNKETTEQICTVASFASTAVLSAVMLYCIFNSGFNAGVMLLSGALLLQLTEKCNYANG